MDQAVLAPAHSDRHHDVLSELADHLRPTVAALRVNAVRLEAAAAHPSHASDAAARDLAGSIVQQTDLMERWVAAMLDVQRIRLGKLRLDVQRVDLVELAKQAAAASPRARIRVVASGPAAVNGDPARLAQVLAAAVDALASDDVTLRIVSARRPPPRENSRLDLKLFVARELARLHGGELWADAGAAIVALPSEIPPFSHMILATSTRCFEAP